MQPHCITKIGVWLSTAPLEKVKLKLKSLCEFQTQKGHAGSYTIATAQFTKSGENCLRISITIKSNLHFHAPPLRPKDQKPETSQQRLMSLCLTGFHELAPERQFRGSRTLICRARAFKCTDPHFTQNCSSSALCSASARCKLGLIWEAANHAHAVPCLN